MCRLFAYVRSGSAVTVRAALGGVLDEFQQLATVHRDGWGSAWRAEDTLSSYHSTTPASADSLFGALTEQAAQAVVVHERWASPGIGLVLDNQQPFVTQGVAFAHNGTLSNQNGNIVDRPPAYREGLGLVGSTTGSDSRLYADLFFLQLARVAGRTAPSAQDVNQALSATIRRLRQDYPDASYNAVIQTDQLTLVVRAHADHPEYSEGLRRGYEKAGWSQRIASYYDIGYTTLRRGGAVVSVASSSGYVASDGWDRLDNNHLLVLRHADAGVEILGLESGEPLTP